MRPPGSPPGSPAGSLVVAKSRFARYSPSLSVVRFFVVGVTVFGALRVVLFLLGEPVERRGVLGVLGLFDQQVLGLLEALCLAAACLIDRLPRRVVAAVLMSLHARTVPAPPRKQTRRSQGTGVSMPAESCRACRPCPDPSPRNRARHRSRAGRARP